MTNLRLPPLTPEIQQQNLHDVFNDLLIIKKLLKQKEDSHRSNYITIRLVTILEQFCRGIIEYQIIHDAEHVKLPPEITIRTIDIDESKQMSKSKIISISYPFQNVDHIKENLGRYNIKNIWDGSNSKLKNEIRELAYNRHNAVHTVSTIDYDVQRGYDAVEKFMRYICEKIFQTDHMFHKHIYDAFHERFHEAIEYFDETIKLEPKNSYLYILKHNALESLHKHAEARECLEAAVEHLEEAIKEDPTNANLHNDKGSILWILEKHEEAVECLEEAVRLEPKNGALYRFKGFALQSLGKNVEAVECFNEAIKLGVKDLIMYLHKGSALKNLGKNVEAVECLEDAIKIDPNDPVAYEFIAEILYAQGKDNKAKEYDLQAKKLRKHSSASR